jgi:hypothetical protein
MDSPWTPHGLSPWIPWTIPHGFYGILKDLIRILINVIMYNLIPLYCIYKVKKKKCTVDELNSGPWGT